MEGQQEGTVQLEVGVLEARRNRGERGIPNLGSAGSGSSKRITPKGGLI